MRVGDRLVGQPGGVALGGLPTPLLVLGTESNHAQSSQKWQLGLATLYLAHDLPQLQIHKVFLAPCRVFVFCCSRRPLGFPGSSGSRAFYLQCGRPGFDPWRREWYSWPPPPPKTRRPLSPRYRSYPVSLKSLCCFVRNCHTVFQGSCTISHSHRQLKRVPVAPQPWKHLVSSGFWIWSILIEVQWILIVGFSIVFLVFLFVFSIVYILHGKIFLVSFKMIL